MFEQVPADFFVGTTADEFWRGLETYLREAIHRLLDKPWILGLANVRGDLLTIVDLAWFLNGKRSKVSMRTRLLAASLRGRPVGLLVDEVFGQRHFVSDEGKSIQLPKSSPLTNFVRMQYRSGKDVWQELDLESLFTTNEFLNGAAA